MWTQRLVFHADDRKAGSPYGSPEYNMVNLPNLQNCDYVKVRVLEALVSCEIASGGDESFLELSIVGKSPLNQTRASGTGSGKPKAELAHIPYTLKEQSQASFYSLLNRDAEHDYLVFPKQEFQDTNIKLEMVDAGDTGLIEVPSSGSFANYTIVLSIEPIPRK